MSAPEDWFRLLQRRLRGLEPLAHGTVEEDLITATQRAIPTLLKQQGRDFWSLYPMATTFDEIVEALSEPAENCSNYRRAGQIVGEALGRHLVEEAMSPAFALRGAQSYAESAASALMGALAAEPEERRRRWAWLNGFVHGLHQALGK